MPLNSGALVGSYRILAPLGAGGMGEVYRARDEKLNRDIALKLLSADLAANADHLRRFEQEARAASALNHPNIITIYDIGRSGDTAYIAMELVEGQDLRTLQAGERLPIKNVLRIAVKVADALAAAHERGIVHRDLKPENVMMSRDGFVKIVDFGLAKLARPITETETTAPHTTPGAVFGTVSYMSPEQAAGRAVDFRSDQFSLGVIVYEMLAGRMPFSEGSAAETLAAIIRTDPPPISRINEAVTPELQRVIDRCLAKDPAERYASTRDLARDLREIRHRVSNSSEPRYRSDRPPLAGVRRAPLWIGAGAAVLMLIAGGVVMYQNHEEHLPPPAKPASAIPAVVVVPFRDAAGTAEGQVFSEGITEMMRARLLSSNAIRVATPPEGTPLNDVRELARRSGASILLRGSVERSGDKLSVAYALVDGATGAEVAHDRVEGAASNVFSLEDHLVQRILQSLHVTHVPKSSGPTLADFSSPEDQRAYVEAVGLLQRSKDEKSVDRAISTLEQLLNNARDSASVNALLGRALYYKSQLSRRPGLVEQASVYAERAAEIDGSLPDVHITLGQLRLAVGRNAEAAAEFERVLNTSPNSPDAVLGLASAYELMGRGGDAERMYKRAIALSPDRASPYDYYGSFCYRRGHYPDAVTNFRKVTELQPDAPRGYVHLGAAYHVLGRYDDALAAYNRSIAIQPTSGAYSNAGTIHFTLGRYADACKAFEKATELAPSDYRTWANLGDAYRWTPGMRAKSVAAYERSLKQAREAMAVNPHDAFVKALAAACLAKSGRLDEGNTMISEALKIDPTSSMVLYEAAVVAVLGGKNDVGVNWLQRAVAAGYPVADAKRDPEFTALRNDPSFQNAVSKS